MTPPRRPSPTKNAINPISTQSLFKSLVNPPRPQGLFLPLLFFPTVFFLSFFFSSFFLLFPPPFSLFFFFPFFFFFFFPVFSSPLPFLPAHRRPQTGNKETGLPPHDRSDGPISNQVRHHWVRGSPFFSRDAMRGKVRGGPYGWRSDRTRDITVAAAAQNPTEDVAEPPGNPRSG